MNYAIVLKSIQVSYFFDAYTIERFLMDGMCIADNNTQEIIHIANLFPCSMYTVIKHCFCHFLFQLCVQQKNF